jgi:hypothetical protein
MAPSMGALPIRPPDRFLENGYLRTGLFVKGDDGSMSPWVLQTMSDYLTGGSSISR